MFPTFCNSRQIALITEKTSYSRGKKKQKDKR